MTNGDKRAVHPQYSAIIRTYNSAASLPATLRCLAVQIAAPARYVIVDSGSTDHTLALAPAGAFVHRYQGLQFNYSEAINQGLMYVDTPFTLVISSHTTLNHPGAMQYALALLERQPRMGAAYFCEDRSSQLAHSIIEQTNFNGFNGLWNTCSLIKTPLLRERPFRPDVFAAEDQEWAQWALQTRGLSIARISGSGVHVDNPRYRYEQKRLNEYISIAYFVNRRLLGFSNLMRIAALALSQSIRRHDFGEAKFYLKLLSRLLACHFREPRGTSRYF